MRQRIVNLILALLLMTTAVERYVATAKAAGCPADQLRNFRRQHRVAAKATCGQRRGPAV